MILNSTVERFATAVPWLQKRSLYALDVGGKLKLIHGLPPHKNKPSQN